MGNNNILTIFMLEINSYIIFFFFEKERGGLILLFGSLKRPPLSYPRWHPVESIILLND